MERLSFGGNAQYKTLFHKKERELVQSYLNSFKAQLKEVTELDDNLKRNYKWVELKANIELCQKLLGRG